MPRKIPNRELRRLSPEEFRKSPRLPLVLVLDNVRSQHNIGSAFRTSDAFALEHICLCGSQPVRRHPKSTSPPWEQKMPLNGRIVKTRWMRYAHYRKRAIRSWPLNRPRAVCLTDFHPGKDKKTALVFGNEVRGVTQEVVDACDGCIEIPQHGTKHSLNVSVAIGVVLWHCYLTIKV